MATLSAAMKRRRRIGAIVLAIGAALLGMAIAQAARPPGGFCKKQWPH